VLDGRPGCDTTEVTERMRFPRGDVEIAARLDGVEDAGGGKGRQQSDSRPVSSASEAKAPSSPLFASTKAILVADTAR